MPLRSHKFNTYELNLHFFLSNWGEGSLYARYYLIRTACLRYLVARKKGDHGRLPEMLYLEIISKIIMQIEDLAHICLFVADQSRQANTFYYSTNEEINRFFQDGMFVSDNNINRYMGLDFSFDTLILDMPSRTRAEEIIKQSKEKFKEMLLAIIKYWHDNHLIAKHYLHGLPNLSLQEARDILPVNVEEATYENEVTKRPKDFMTVLMNNDTTGGREFNTIEHTPKAVKQLLKFSLTIYTVTKAITFTELSKLDFSVNGSRHLYLLDFEGRSEEDVALIKKYFLLSWMN